MKRFLLVLIITLLFPSADCVNAAEIKIDINDQVGNVAPGYCMWCSLETMGRHTKRRKLYGLADRYKRQRFWRRENGRWAQKREGGATYDEAVHQLEKLDVKFYASDSRGDALRFIKKSCDNGIGSVIGLADWTGGTKKHAVLVTKLTDKTVEFVDSNERGPTWRVDRDWFDYYWLGWAITLKP